MWSRVRYTGCIKKVDPFKQPQFKLAAICCINLTVLNAWNQ